MKYTKIKDLAQYNAYCNKHEALFIQDEEKFIDEIELLEILIEDYDRRLFATKMEDLNPVELLKSLLENGGISQFSFAKEIGISPQLVSDILNYRRNISKKLVLKFSKYFAMTQEAFGREYELKGKSDALISQRHRNKPLKRYVIPERKCAYLEEPQVDYKASKINKTYEADDKATKETEKSKTSDKANKDDKLNNKD